VTKVGAIMEKKLKALVAGHICLDITPILDQQSDQSLQDVIAPGALSTVKDAVISLGGAVANVGLALKKLGIPVCMNSMIGDDEFGMIIEQKIRDAGAECALTKKAGVLSSFSIVLSVKGCDRIFFHAPGANNIYQSKDIGDDVLKNADILHFGYPPIMRQMFKDNGNDLRILLSRAKEAGLITSLDMAMPDPMSESGQVNWISVLENVLPYVDIYVPSIEETLFMIDRDTYDDYKERSKNCDMIDVLDLNILDRLADQLHQMGPRVVLLKCGYKGCYISTRELPNNFLGFNQALRGNWSNRRRFEKSYKVEDIATTTGAGDTTIAGLLAAIMSHYTLENAIATAVAVGALCVQSDAVVDKILPLEDIRNLAEKWGKRP